MSTPVYVDTNALMLFGQGVDLFTLLDDAMEEPYEIVVIKPVLDELHRLALGASKDARAAKLGVVIVAERQKTQALKIDRGSDGYADEALLATAEGVVCTLDKELQRRLLDAGRRVLGVRQGQLRFVR